MSEDPVGARSGQQQGAPDLATAKIEEPLFTSPRLWGLVIVMAGLIVGGFTERLMSGGDLAELARVVQSHEQQLAQIQKSWVEFTSANEIMRREARSEREELRKAVTELSVQVAVLADRVGRLAER